MAKVKPFKGYRYNQERIRDMSDVVAPPYDVISPMGQDTYYKRHPSNIIRLILGKTKDGDDSRDNVHSRSGDYLYHWVENGVLVQDQRPCFYLTTVEFSFGDHQGVRYDLIGLVRLEPFEKGIILPHEHTFSKVKSERLGLMKACNANLCPIFGLYSDGAGLIEILRTASNQGPPDFEFTDDQGLHHKTWCISEESVLDRISAAFSKSRIFIADGHHRYETALNYREWIKSHSPDFDENHPANYVMMSFSSLEDPGLIILPAHRLLKGIPSDAVSGLLERAVDYFEIETISMGNGLSQALSDAKRVLKVNEDRNAFGIFARAPEVFSVLILKEGVMEDLFGQSIPRPLQVLDVTVATQLILIRLLGFKQSDLDDEMRIIYRTEIKEAAQAIINKEADLGIFLNPTKIEQVQQVAEIGLVMPRKSTYFAPKVISGQVLNLLRLP